MSKFYHFGGALSILGGPQLRCHVQDGRHGCIAVQQQQQQQQQQQGGKTIILLTFISFIHWPRTD